MSSLAEDDKRKCESPKIVAEQVDRTASVSDKQQLTPPHGADTSEPILCEIREAR